MLRPTATRLPAAFSALTRRTLATGPASGGSVSDEMIEKLGSPRPKRSSTACGSWPPGAHIEGARSLAPGQKCAGRAVTLNFVPQRPDIQADKPPGGESPEYEAFELCGPKEVLVMSSVGPWESVGGDIKSSD